MSVARAARARGEVQLPLHKSWLDCYNGRLCWQHPPTQGNL